MNEVRDSIAQKLKYLRNREGKTVDEIGAVVERSGKTVAAWEVGRGQPDADTFRILCQYFKVPISYFIPDERITHSPISLNTVDEEYIVSAMREMNREGINRLKMCVNDLLQVNAYKKTC